MFTANGYPIANRHLKYSRPGLYTWRQICEKRKEWGSTLHVVTMVTF